jgi:hypothetical protein
MTPWDPSEYDGEDERFERTVFLVGTGAEEGAWPPVLKAIETLFPLGQAAGAGGEWGNFVMAKLVAVNRAQHASAKYGAHDQRDLQRLRGEIATALRQAVDAGALRLRPKFLEVAQNPEWGETVFLTTNWDTSIKNALPSADVRYVHGSASDPTTLYLPSDYAFDPSHAESTRSGMLQAQHDCIETLWEASTIVIYGLSLDPLDGELAAICATGFQEKVSGEERLKKIVIYDVEAKKATLTDRVRWLHPAPDTVEIEFRAVDAKVSKPAGRAPKASKPSGRIAKASKPGGRPPKASKPSGRVAKAGKPGGRAPKANKPTGRVAKVSKPSGRAAAATKQLRRR